MNFCSCCSVANNSKDPVIHCLLCVFCDWASAHLLSTQKSYSFCNHFSFWQKLCSILNAAVQLQASLTYYRFFLQGLILFWHNSIQKSIVGLCFHCEHAVHFRGSWIHISLSFRFPATRRMECDCRFLWLSETFSNFPELILDKHLKFIYMPRLLNAYLEYYPLVLLQLCYGNLSFKLSF